jgi:hypothetical protein
MINAQAIVADQVSKQFPGAEGPAVDHCSFAVEQGQFVVGLWQDDTPEDDQSPV